MDAGLLANWNTEKNHVIADGLVRSKVFPNFIFCLGLLKLE